MIVHGKTFGVVLSAKLQLETCESSSLFSARVILGIGAVSAWLFY